MKRLLSILIISLIMISLVSCSNKQHDHNHNEENNNPLVGESPDRNDVEEYDLTIAALQGTYEAQISGVFDAFEEKYNLKIRTIEYDGEQDYFGLNTKLLAKDTDIDVFYSVSLPLHTYIGSDYFVDLSQYDNLKIRFDSSNYAKYVGSYEGKYFGVPTVPSIPRKAWIIMSYKIRNINLATGSYSDSNGDELFEALKHYYKYSDNHETQMYGFYQEDYSFISSDYFIMSPYSQNKETAVLFLEMVFDHLNSGEKPIEITMPDGTSASILNSYPNNIELSDVYMAWSFNDSPNATRPIGNAFSAALQSDGSDEALRKLAKEAAREVRKRLEG